MAVDVVRRLTSWDGIIYTNLPLAVDVIAAQVSKARGCSPDEVSRRIRLFKSDELRDWKAGNSGPWELANELKESGDLGELLLDECHLFCPATDYKRRPPWERWLGEVRHEGWSRVVFITQDESKVGKPITQHAELRFELTNAEKLRDPWLGVPWGAWYELIASFTRQYQAVVRLTEYRRVNGRMTTNYVENFKLDSENFKLYRSYEATGGGTQTGQATAGRKYEYQRRGVVGFKRDATSKRLLAPTWLWFFGQAWFPLSRSAAIVGFAVYMLVFGGLSSAIAGMQTKFNAGMKSAVGLKGDNEDDSGRMAADEARGSAGASGDGGGGRSVGSAQPGKATADVPRKRTDESQAPGSPTSSGPGSVRGDSENDGGEAQTLPTLEQLIERVRLVGIFPSQVVFDNGEILEVGQTLVGDSSALSGIDIRRRQCGFVDGSIVPLGGVREWPLPPGGKTVWAKPAVVAESLSYEGSGGFASQPTSESRRQNRDRRGAGDASGFVPSRGLGSNGDHDHSGSGPRRLDDNAGRTRPAARRGVRTN